MWCEGMYSVRMECTEWTDEVRRTAALYVGWVACNYPGTVSPECWLALACITHGSAVCAKFVCQSVCVGSCAYVYKMYPVYAFGMRIPFSQTIQVSHKLLTSFMPVLYQWLHFFCIVTFLLLSMCFVLFNTNTSSNMTFTPIVNIWPNQLSSHGTIFSFDLQWETFHCQIKLFEEQYLKENSSTDIWSNCMVKF